MDEVQVEIVQIETPKGGVDRLVGGLLAGVLDLQLGGDEQIRSVDAAARDGAADRLHVAGGRGGVEEPVAGSERVGHHGRS